MKPWIWVDPRRFDIQKEVEKKLRISIGNGKTMGTSGTKFSPPLSFSPQDVTDLNPMQTKVSREAFVPDSDLELSRIFSDAPLPEETTGLQPLPVICGGKGSFGLWKTMNWPESPFWGSTSSPEGSLSSDSRPPVLVLVNGNGGISRYPGVEDYLVSLKTRGWIIEQRVMDQEPRDTLLDSWLDELRLVNVQGVLGIGGGSVLDGAKVLSALLTVAGATVKYLEGVGIFPPPSSRLPLVLVPTTGGTGSEVTMNAVVSGQLPDGTGFKKSIRHSRYVPDWAVLDPAFMTGVPPSVTAACGTDALSQLLESHFSIKATEVTRKWTEVGFQSTSRGLEAAVFEPENPSARLDMAVGALCSGVGLANAGLGLVHGIVGAMGASIPVPHGVGCARLLSAFFPLVFHKMSLTNHGDLDEVRKIARLFFGNKSPVDQNEIQNGTHISKQEEIVWFLDYLGSLADDLGVPPLSSYGWTSEMVTELGSKAQNRNSSMALEKDEILEGLFRLV